MSTGAILLLGAFAGFTIYLGLPLAFVRRAPTSLRMFLSMVATGVLLFLLYDVLSKASEPIDEALTLMSKGQGSGPLLTDLVLLVLGLVIGSLGLVYFNKLVLGRLKSGPKPGVGKLRGGVARLARTIVPPQMALSAAETGAVAAVPAVSAQPAAVAVAELSSHALAFIIAIGIGLHNFSEGLAIGQSAASGALSLATVLIIGFGLHNMTEGFGIAGPLSGQRVSWSFIGLLGLVAGGPTFLGTVIGIQFHSPQVFIFSLALAAGAIVFVLVELMGVAKRFKAQDIVMWGLLAGFLLGYVTDLIVSLAGA